MKEMNVSMSDELFDHFSKLSKIVSVLYGKDVSVSDVVLKTASEFCNFGLVDLFINEYDGSYGISAKHLVGREDFSLLSYSAELDEKLTDVDWFGDK